MWHRPTRLSGAFRASFLLEVLVMKQVVSRGLLVLSVTGFGIALGAAQWSCSSEEEAVPAGDYATQTAEAYCGSLKGCCDGKKLEFDGASCRAQIAYDVQAMLDTTKRGKVTFNGVAGKQCQDSLRARVSQCSGDADAGAGDDPLSNVCRQVFVGSVKVGAACGTDLDCATSASNEVGICRIDDRKDGDPTKKVCFTRATKVAKGAACTVGLPKNDFSQLDCTGYCDTQLGDDGEHGKCQDYAAKDETCVDTSTPGKVLYRVCAKGTFCSPTSRKCTAAPTGGRDCAQGYNGLTGSLGRSCGGADLFCAPDNEGGPGTCTELVGTGESCADNSDCFSGVCNFLSAEESDGGADAGSSARAGTCASPAGSVAEAEISQPYEVSARTCAFGPDAIGPVDQGVVKTSKLLGFR